MAGYKARVRLEAPRASLVCQVRVMFAHVSSTPDTTTSILFVATTSSLCQQLAHASITYPFTKGAFTYMPGKFQRKPQCEDMAEECRLLMVFVSSPNDRQVNDDLR